VRFVHLFARADLGYRNVHQWPPSSVVINGSVSMTKPKSGRSSLMPRSPFQLGERRNLDRYRPMLSACAGSRSPAYLVAGILQQIVEVGAAGGHLQPVDAAVAPIVEKNDIQLQASMTEVAISEFSIM